MPTAPDRPFETWTLEEVVALADAEPVTTMPGSSRRTVSGVASAGSVRWVVAVGVAFADRAVRYVDTTRRVHALSSGMQSTKQAHRSGLFYLNCHRQTGVSEVTRKRARNTHNIFLETSPIVTELQNLVST
jgi:hypothetical protein